MSGHAATIAGAERFGDNSPWSRKLALFIQSPPDLATCVTRATDIQARADQFDLMFVRSANAWQFTFDPTTALNEANMASELAAFEAANFGNMKFILTLITNGAATHNYGTDAHWTNMGNNLAKIGRVFRDSTKFTGVFWDWEWYAGGGVYWFDDGSAVGVPGATLADRATYVRGRFKTLFERLLDEWPDVHWSCSHGAGSGSTLQYNYLGTGGFHAVHNDVGFANEFMGSAFVGLVEAAYDRGQVARLYDGGEYYGVRSALDMWRVRNFQQVILPQNPNVGGTYVSSLMTGMSGKYNVGSNIGLYDKSDYPGTSSPEGVAQFANLPHTSFAPMISNAMRNIGSLTWLYSEAYDWIGVGGKTAVPSNILDACAEGRRLGRL